MNKKSISTPIINKVEFLKRLRHRLLEDVRLIATLEAFLVRRRGYVFRIPPKGASVILLLSGGIDSTVAWYVLSRVYKLHVYPFFVKPYGPCPQERSVFEFSQFYQRLFEQRYHKPFTVTHNFFPKEMEECAHVNNMHVKTLLDMYNPEKHTVEVKSLSGLNGMAVHFGVLYSRYLLVKHGININTIFCAVTCNDGIGISSQTLTSLRSTLVCLMRFHNMPNLQYASVFFEKDTGWFAAKRDIIALGVAAGLPLERTYSCYAGAPMHCGECEGCVARRYEFKRAGVEDQTVYASAKMHVGLANFFSPSILKKCLRKVKRVLFSKSRGN